MTMLVRNAGNQLNPELMGESADSYGDGDVGTDTAIEAL
jgi:hypothetical protein